jgi:hypothetical protein
VSGPFNLDSRVTARLPGGEKVSGTFFLAGRTDQARFSFRAVLGAKGGGKGCSQFRLG